MKAQRKATFEPRVFFGWHSRHSTENRSEINFRPHLIKDHSTTRKQPTKAPASSLAKTRKFLVSIREHLESLESLVIRLRRSDSQEPGDVDEREPWSV